MPVVLELVGDAELVQRAGAEHVEHEHRVVRRDRAARFADDLRVRDAARVAYARDPVHDVARVLVERVVHRRFVVRAAAVVVDAQAAADVHVLDPGAEESQLRIDVRQLGDRVLDPPDVLQLRADVAVHELEAVEHVVALEHLDHLEDLGDEQPELRLLARRLAPAPGTLGGELHPHADVRPDAVLLGVLEDQAELGEILHHRHDPAAELGRQRHRLDVAVVLEAVADDQPVGVVLGQAHHHQQLRLGADLKAEPERGTAAVDLLDDQPLLVHLDREHGRVAAAIVVLRDRLGEGVVQALQAVGDDVGEADHDRRRQVAGLQALDDVEQVDLAADLLVRADCHVAGLVDPEVAAAPGIDLVQLRGVVDLPAERGGKLGRGVVHWRRAR